MVVNLFYRLPHLLCNSLHTLSRWVSITLFDVLELDAGDGVVFADGEGGFHDVGAKFAVDNEVDVNIWVTRKSIVEEFGEGGAVRVEVAALEVGVLVVANLCARPTVVGTAKNQENIGAANAGKPRDE